ncbi:MAG: type IV secretion system DNA-binding domain-containing protein [Alphaproteobacteria bacterium]|jgi:type IV conjugative transfer system coupling protein TraD
MTQRSSLTHTDRATKGGQIFSHIWRMKLQNLNLLLIIFFVTFFFASLFFLLMKKVTWWECFDFYIESYLCGVIKLLTWDVWKDYILYPLDEVSMGISHLLGKKKQHIESIYLRKSDLKTLLFVPKWGGAYIWKTHLFLKEPWVKGLAALFNGCLYKGGVVSGCVSLLMLWYFNYKGRRTETPHIISGKDQVTEKTLSQLIGKKKSSLMLSPILPFVEGTQTEHTLLVGSTGQGKTNRMLDILKQLRSQKKKAIILDITGEFTATFFRQGVDILLNPLDERSHTWDVWSEDLSAHEYDAWAASMVAENQRDPVWHEMARKLLSTTALRLSESSDKSMKKILEWACWKPLDEATATFYAESPVSGLMQSSSEKTTVGVRMNLSAGISALELLDEAGESFSITKWMKEDTDEWLFLTALPSQRNSLAPLLASWFNFSFLGLERCGPQHDRQIWFVIDELPGLRYRIDALPRMVAEGRKYGACCLFGFQNKAQLDHLFGQHDAKAILSNCSTKIIYRTPESQTAEYIANTLGRLEIQESSENLSLGAHQMRDGVNLSQSRRDKYVVTPTDIMNLERFEAYVSLPGDYPIAKVKFPLVKMSPLCEPFVPKVTPQERTKPSWPDLEDATQDMKDFLKQLSSQT